MTSSFDFIKKHKFISIIRRLEPKYTKPLAEALYNGGIRIFEVTFNPSDSATCNITSEIIKEIKKLYGDEVMVGAGTVVCMDYAKTAYEAGAEFIVSPCTDKKIIDFSKQNNILVMPGAYTPTEIMNAYNMGADIVKIFPIAPDQIGYLKNVLSPLSHIPFVPTGGVNPDTIKPFMEMGAVAVGAGLSVYTNEMLEKGEYDKITKNAKLHTSIVKEY